MSKTLKFHFPLPALLHDGSVILKAAAKYGDRINPRLDDDFVVKIASLGPRVSEADAKHKSDAGDLGSLTVADQAKLATLNQRVSDARETAKKAFKGQDVKLHDEFQMGITSPSDIGAILERARIVSASMKKETNVVALKSKGWLPADSTKLDAAITDMETTEAAQEAAKHAGGTDARNALANDYYDAILAIQNAANLEFPEDGEDGNAAIRAEFLLDTFPPRGGGSKTKDKPAPPPPTS